MAKKKHVRKPGELSLAQLQQLVTDKKSLLDELKAKRAGLQKELDDLDRTIGETQGVGRTKRAYVRKQATSENAAAPAKRKKKVGRKKKRAARASNQKSAKAYAAEILAVEKKGLPLDELAPRVLAAGYNSNASDFKNVLYQSLYNDRRKGKVFDYDENTGHWILR